MHKLKLKLNRQQRPKCEAATQWQTQWKRWTHEIRFWNLWNVFRLRKQIKWSLFDLIWTWKKRAFCSKLKNAVNRLHALSCLIPFFKPIKDTRTFRLCCWCRCDFAQKKKKKKSFSYQHYWNGFAWPSINSFTIRLHKKKYENYCAYRCINLSVNFNWNCFHSGMSLTAVTRCRISMCARRRDNFFFLFSVKIQQIKQRHWVAHWCLPTPCAPFVTKNNRNMNFCCWILMNTFPFMFKYFVSRYLCRRSNRHKIRIFILLSLIISIRLNLFQSWSCC